MTKMMNRTPTGFAGCIFGPPGAGKTSLAKSLPPAQSLYVEIEGGSGPLFEAGWNAESETPAKPTQKDPNAFKNDLDRIINMLRYEKHNFHYVIIDSASEIEKYYQMALCYVAGRPITSLKDYGGGADLMYKTAVELRDLKDPQNNKCGHAVNVIFIAAEFPLPISRTENEELTVLYPLLTKKMALKFAHLLDFQARLEVPANQAGRFLRFHPTNIVAAKCRYQRIQNIANVGPDFNFYEKVVKEILTPVAAPTPTQTKPQSKPATPGSTGRIG